MCCCVTQILRFAGQYEPGKPLMEQITDISILMPCLVLFSVKCVADRFLDEEVCVVRTVKHRIFGKSEACSGVKDSCLAELQILMAKLILKGLAVNQTTCDVKPSEEFNLRGLGSFSIDDTIPPYMDFSVSQGSRMDDICETGLYRTMLKNENQLTRSYTD